MDRTDEALMAAYVAGDSEAFDELFARYAPILLRVMRRQLPREADAHDLVQETFLQLHRARHDFKLDARLKPWLFTIAINLKREHFRRQKRRPETPLDLETGHEPSVEAHDIEHDDEARRVQEALGRLNDDQREVITLHWMEGFSFPEIAAMVGASLSAVKVRAHRGYEKLKQYLEPG
ncbi:MAG: RNA polymerase sigma factor [Myxococcales bacterium]|nr:MAG: RNA polymerase sigma factor [Myxococcales bacterium]